MDTIFKGWEYISAIIDFLKKNVDRKSIITPQFIFRGISMRFISRSNNIENIIKKECKIENYSAEDIKNKTKIKYKEFYDNIINKWNNEFSTCNENIDALNALNKEVKNENTPIAPEYIKSGAAVRLQELYGQHSHHVDYVNYIKHMLNDVKIRFPKYVDEKYSDIEILADLQHKGAASCLVDFSTNILTSLWFATQTHFNEIGYLFCYDINRVIIEEDRLSILDESESSKSIIELLYETTKITRYSGNQSYKFWLWKPSNLNERIARQDSVFIFGLESFKIEDHKIIVIPIPPTWKKPIQQFLKAFFGITAESIYCDIDGYADANSKLTPYDIITLNYFRKESDHSSNFIENLQTGTDCLLRSEYELALKYFTLCESYIKSESYIEGVKGLEKINELSINELNKELDKATLIIELFYSKAVCLKHLQDSIGAINEYNEAWNYYKKLEENKVFEIDLSKYEDEDELSQYDRYKTYVNNKYQKIINALMDMYYDTLQYDKIIEMIEFLPTPKDKDENKNVQVLKTTIKREAYCLKAIEYFIIFSKQNSIQQNIFSIEEPNFSSNDSCIQPYYYVLNFYFDCIIEILNDTSKCPITAFNTYNELICKIKEQKENQKSYDGHLFYSKWNFKDIEYYFNELKEIDKEKYTYLKDITARIRDFENFIKGKVGIEAW